MPHFHISNQIHTTADKLTGKRKCLLFTTKIEVYHKKENVGDKVLPREKWVFRQNFQSN